MANAVDASFGSSFECRERESEGCEEICELGETLRMHIIYYCNFVVDVNVYINGSLMWIEESSR